MKLRRKGIFLDLFLLILSDDEWSMRDCEEGRMMMRL
jgi:hypothetical protein